MCWSAKQTVNGSAPFKRDLPHMLLHLPTGYTARCDELLNICTGSNQSFFHSLYAYQEESSGRGLILWLLCNNGSQATEVITKIHILNSCMHINSHVNGTVGLAWLPCLLSLHHCFFRLESLSPETLCVLKFLRNWDTSSGKKAFRPFWVPLYVPLEVTKVWNFEKTICIDFIFCTLLTL